jgi:hypothetical protein
VKVRSVVAKPWTPEQLALLEGLRADGIAWDEIARQCGHTAASCCTTLSMLKRRRKAGAAIACEQEKRVINRRPWSDADVKSLIRMRDVEKRVFAEIDIALNRAEGASAGKWNTLRVPGVTVPVAETKQAPPPVKLYHKTLTAELCGDPLPGRSALDQKRVASGVSA